MIRRPAPPSRTDRRPPSPRHAVCIARKKVSDRAVRAISENTASDPSNRDLATTMLFSDDPITPQVTMMKAGHLMQLRIAVNAVRLAAGLSAVSFPAATAGVSVISADDLGLAAVSYTRAPLIPGMSVLAADVEEIRGGVR